MFGFDPIDLADPSPYGPLAYYGHILIGTLALVAALTAFAVAKGSLTHKRAGYVYIAAVAIVSLTSIAMLTQVFIGPLFMAVFTAIYAIGGAWLALQPKSRWVTVGEAGLTVLEIAGLLLFLRIAIAAVGEGIVPPTAPAIIALIPVILLTGEVHWFTHEDQRARLRIARHLNRMIWGFVVVLRAPLVELAAAGMPVPAPVVVVGPILLGVGMLIYFRGKYVPRRKDASKGG